MVPSGHEVLFHCGSNKPRIQWVHVDLSPSFDKNVKQPSTVTYELSLEWLQLCFQAPYNKWMFEVVLTHINEPFCTKERILNSLQTSSRNKHGGQRGDPLRSQIWNHPPTARAITCLLPLLRGSAWTAGSLHTCNEDRAWHLRGYLFTLLRYRAGSMGHPSTVPPRMCRLHENMPLCDRHLPSYKTF